MVVLVAAVTLVFILLVGYLVLALKQLQAEKQQLAAQVQECNHLLSSHGTRLSDILDSAITAIISLKVFPDGQWQYLFFSPGCETIFGFTPEELMADQHLWHSRVAPEDLAQVTQVSIPIVLAEGMITVEYRFHHKDGSLRWIAGTFSSRRDDDADCWVVTAVGADISERMRLEADRQQAAVALQAQDDQLRQIVENIQDVFFLRCLETGKLLYINRMYDQIFQQRCEALYHNPGGWLDCIHPLDRERIQTKFQQELQGKAFFDDEYRLLLSDGSIRWIWDRSFPILNQAGQAYRVAGVAKDISDRKHLELALQDSEQRYHSLVDNIPGVVFRAAGIEDHWQTIYVNDFVSQICGYPATDFIQDQVRSWLSIIHPEDQVQVQQRIDTALAERGDYSLEYRIIHADGSVRWVLERGQGVFSPTRELKWIDGVIFDISERVHLEADRLQIETQLRASLHEKEILLGEVHHRVKNNLQVISSLLAIQADLISDPSTKAALEDSRNRIQAMATVHQSLYQSENFARINFSAYIHALSSGLFIALNINPAAIQLQVEIAPELTLPLIQAIPCGLILNELLTNALKHGFRRGQLRGRMTVSLSAADAQLTLRVANNGEPLPADFELTESASMGIQLVTLLTQQLQGTLTVDRVPETTFQVTFREIIN